MVKEYETLASVLHLGVDSSGWFWNEGNRHKKNLNPHADANDSEYITKTINGRYAKLADIEERRTKTNLLLKSFNAQNCINIKK